MARLRPSCNNSGAVAMGSLLDPVCRKAGPVALTPEQHRARVVDFAFANAAIENPLVTREMIERVYDRRHPANGIGR